MKIKITFPYEDFPPLYIDEKLVIDVIQPRIKFNPETTNSKIIKLGLEQPINSPALKDLI